MHHDATTRKQIAEQFVVAKPRLRVRPSSWPPTPRAIRSSSAPRDVAQSGLRLLMLLLLAVISVGSVATLLFYGALDTTPQPIRVPQRDATRTSGHFPTTASMPASPRARCATPSSAESHRLAAGRDGARRCATRTSIASASARRCSPTPISSIAVSRVQLPQLRSERRSLRALSVLRRRHAERTATSHTRCCATAASKTAI